MASQTITGPDLQYTQDNKHCYAFGGTHTVTNTTRTFLEFNLTGGGYIVAKFFFGFDATGLSATQETGYEIFFNDISIMHNTSPHPDNVWMIGPREVIIPPFTSVKVTMETSDASGVLLNASMTGRVYEYLPVRN